jgi:hypothetical protein
MRTLDELADTLDALAVISGPRGAAIGVADPQIARYARALEFGSVAGEKPWPQPGPRTTLAVHPQTGEQVVVSVQAPQGFIRANLSQFIEALVREMGRPANWLDPAKVEAHLSAAVQRSADAALDALKQAAPRESGRLAQSLVVVEGND